PVTLPSQDMIIGLHHLTTVKEGATGEGRAFGSVSEAILAKDEGTLDLQAKIRIRIPGMAFLEGEAPEGYENHHLVDASLGQAIFNATLPKAYPVVREPADKGKLSQIVNKLAEESPKVETAATLDRIKDAGFYWATRSGVTVALSDVLTPPNKKEIVAKHEKLAAKVQSQYEK